MRPTAVLPPNRLVDAHGNVAFGVYCAPVRNINLRDARPWLGPVRMPLSLARFRLKEWEHYAIITPELMLTLAVVDSKFLRVSWCQVVDRASGATFEHGRQGPGLRVSIAEQLWRDDTRAKAKGYRVEINHDLSGGAHHIDVDIDAAGTKPAVRARLECLHDLERIEPLAVVMPVGPGRGAYTHKVALPVRGEIVSGEQRWAIDAQDSFAILDIHKAHYPRHTWWRWATCAGRDSTGRSVAINLTHNVNDRDTEISENAIWVDGRLEMLAPSRFRFHARRPMDPWHLTTLDGAVDLEFRPQGERRDDIRLGLVRSVFRQPYGTFHGTVNAAGGPVQFDGFMGICEDHDALW